LSSIAIHNTPQVPVVVTADPDDDVDEAAVALELERDHGYDSGRARAVTAGAGIIPQRAPRRTQVAATAAKLHRLQKGPPTTEERYVHWWARKRAARAESRRPVLGHTSVGRLPLSAEKTRRGLDKRRGTAHLG
jgi:hypothetical protein